MNLAVLTAWSPNYARVANIAVPTHRYLAAKLGACFFELPLPEDGLHNRYKCELIKRWLGCWHSVLWLDADCFVPLDWKLPDRLNGDGPRYFFPRTTECGELHYWHFAALYVNTPESFQLLDEMLKLWQRVANDTLQDQRALNWALGADPLLRARVGALPRGLAHFHALPIPDKAAKLQAVLPYSA